ncbi:hypothetical protein NDU88_000794, partial [Pleurodeles waltl]
GSLMLPGWAGLVRRERSCSAGSHGPRISPKQRRRKEQGSLMLPGWAGLVRRERSCSAGSHGPRISPKQRRRKEQ